MAGAIEATGPNIRQTRKCLHYYIICVHYFIRLSGRPETDWVLPEPDQHRKTESSFRFRFTGTGFSENQIPFRPDRISKFNRIPAGFHNLARLLPDFKIQPDSYRNPKVLTMLIT